MHISSTSYRNLTLGYSIVLCWVNIERKSHSSTIQKATFCFLVPYTNMSEQCFLASGHPQFKTYWSSQFFSTFFNLVQFLPELHMKHCFFVYPNSTTNVLCVMWAILHDETLVSWNIMCKDAVYEMHKTVKPDIHFCSTIFG